MDISITLFTDNVYALCACAKNPFGEREKHQKRYKMKSKPWLLLHLQKPFMNFKMEQKASILLHSLSQ